ncbi:diguanylate cyclase (GGDEF)-like protein [Rhizobium aquaticum]|uniref:diguanylate cyclase n=1 Tax=Rhizobium aquaticum TaxID=1549636 RepID=A0ABV2J063_9HYPH
MFYRHEDGSYTQRPGVFEGEPLADGRRYKGMSATYAPDVSPNDDVKARFALSFELAFKYGSSSRGEIFNFYGVVPEKGFPIYQSVDVGKAFTYSGPDALKLETFEFYTRGFDEREKDPFFTKMYWDSSNNGWMVTVAVPDASAQPGRRVILACSDVLLDELMRRVASPPIKGSYGSLFMADADGTLIFERDHLADIKTSEGSASIKSLGLVQSVPLLKASRGLGPDEVKLVETDREIVAVTTLASTPWILAIHYPLELMRPAVLQNFAIVIATGLLTLLVELFIIRSVLIKQVSQPLERLIRAVNLVGKSQGSLDAGDLPTASQDEIGQLARDFQMMATRVQEGRLRLEEKVQERTERLQEANDRLVELSITDPLTGVANRRRFDAVLEAEWSRAQRSGSSLTLAMLDVDYFKNFNDGYGHIAGDECLRRIADLLKEVLPGSAGLVARYGGEEFVLLLADAAESGSLIASIQEKLKALALPHSGSPFGTVTVSIGWATMTPTDASVAASLVELADKALYAAKNAGRNRSIKA